MSFRKFARWVGITIASIAAILALSILFLWVKFRIPTGPYIEYKTLVRYQMIDLGQIEPSQLRYWVIEPITRHSRLFLLDGPLKFIYVPNKQIALCWPEPPSDMQEKGYTIEITYRTRKLMFSEGTIPATLTNIQRVPGNPRITK